MKKTLLCSLLFSSFLSFGQNPITISSTEIPYTGLAYLNINQGLLNPFYEGNAGQNQLYDPIFFEEANTDTTIFKNPSETVFSVGFESSNLMSYISGDSTIYFLNSSDTLVEEVGRYELIDIIGLNTKFYNTNPLLEYKLPINYGDSFIDSGLYFTDKFYYPIGFPSGTIPGSDTAYFDSVYINRTITRDSKIDGWGTLLTPDGEFNVLRQNTTEYDFIQPIFRLTVVYFGFPITSWQAIAGFDFRDTSFKYKYLSKDHPHVLAEINKGVGGIVRDAKYTKVHDASLNKLDKDVKVTCFPNPSSETIRIESENQLLSYTITSLDGRTISEKFINSSSEIIDLTNFKTGEYIITIQTVKGKIAKKIVKI
jgi:hypothetical protein